jgi:hypothetical protein
MLADYARGLEAAGFIGSGVFGGVEMVGGFIFLGGGAASEAGSFGLSTPLSGPMMVGGLMLVRDGAERTANFGSGLVSVFNDERPPSIVPGPYFIDRYLQNSVGDEKSLASFYLASTFFAFSPSASPRVFAVESEVANYVRGTSQATTIGSRATLPWARNQAGVAPLAPADEFGNLFGGMGMPAVRPLGLPAPKDFQNVTGIRDLASRIPSNATRLPWKDVPGGAEQGIKWRWVDSRGNNWQVRSHSLDPGAPVGSNAGRGWIYRVEVNPANTGGTWYMDATGTFWKQNTLKPNSPFHVPGAANATHIPFAPR